MSAFLRHPRPVFMPLLHPPTGHWKHLPGRGQLHHVRPLYSGRPQEALLSLLLLSLALHPEPSWGSYSPQDGRVSGVQTDPRSAQHLNSWLSSLSALVLPSWFLLQDSGTRHTGASPSEAQWRDSHQCGPLYLPDSQAGSAFLARSCPCRVGFVFV